MRSSVNYNHLRYFWTVARTGSATSAARVLNLTQPTISAQLRQFEASVGAALFEGDGRDRRLTEAGRLLYRFAEEVFSLEREIHDRFAGLPTGRSRPFRVGVTDGIPKLLVHRFLAPLLALDPAPSLLVREGSQDALLTSLEAHALDVVLLDAPASHGFQGRTHGVGESDVALFGTESLVRDFEAGYPESLKDAPVLMPPAGSVMRQLLDAWLAVKQLEPRIVAELDDTALLKAFATAGHGLVALPVAVASDAAKRYGLQPLGPVEGARVLYYALTIDRTLEDDMAGLVAVLSQQLVTEQAS
jgi:LysR family transcriptional regulator, transcriptional activator of nhaA